MLTYFNSEVLYCSIKTNQTAFKRQRCELTIGVLLTTSYLVDHEVLVSHAVWYNTGHAMMQRGRGLLLLLE